MKNTIMSIFLLLPLTTQAEGNIEQGENIFKNQCQACHQTPGPGALSMKQWQHVLNTMQTRMQQLGMDRLTPEQMESVLMYLEQQQ